MIKLKYMRQSVTFKFDEEIISKNAQCLTFIMHEALSLLKFLKTKLQIESKIKKFLFGTKLSVENIRMEEKSAIPR